MKIALSIATLAITGAAHVNAAGESDYSMATLNDDGAEVTEIGALLSEQPPMLALFECLGADVQACPIERSKCGAEDLACACNQLGAIMTCFDPDEIRSKCGDQTQLALDGREQYLQEFRGTCERNGTPAVGGATRGVAGVASALAAVFAGVGAVLV